MFSIFTQLRVIIWWFAVTRWKRSKLHSIQDSKSEEKKFKIKKRWASASRTAEIKWRLKEKYELACIELCPTDTQQHNYNKQFQISTCEHTLRHFTFWIEKTAEFFFRHCCGCLLNGGHWAQQKKTFKEMRSTDTMYVSYLKDYGPGGKWIVIIWTAEMIILYI